MGKTHKPGTKLQKGSAVGAVIAAIGLLSVQVLVAPDKLVGWNLLHILQIVLVAIAAASAVGLASSEVKRHRSKSEIKK